MTTPTVTTPARPSDAVLIRRTEALQERARRNAGLPTLPKEPTPKRGRGRPVGSLDRVPRKPMPPRPRLASVKLDTVARRKLRALVNLASLRQGKRVTLAEALTEALAVAMLAAAKEHGAG